MKILTVLTILLWLPFCLPAQNLVPNCDFSNYISCPTEYGQFDYAKDWYTPGEGTSDLCHTCGGGNAGVPNNMWGYEPAYSGTGYGHIICYYPFQGYNYREYMEAELACLLEAGKTYRVSFFVSCSDNSRYAIDGIGLLLSENAVSQSGSTVINPGIPVTVSQDPGVPITKKDGWKEIHGIYTATGNEKFITIGNFTSDNDLTIMDFAGSLTQYSSFYIDMVSVTPMNPMLDLGPDTTLCYGESFLLNALIPCNTNYLWEDGSTNPLRNITLPGTYRVDIQLGCSMISDEITISWNPEPESIFPPDTVLCSGSSMFLCASHSFDDYLWQDGSKDSSFLADQAGIYWLEVTYGTGCRYRDTVIISSIDLPMVNLGDDQEICFGDSLLLDAGNDNIYSQYVWNNNSTGRFLQVKQDGLYSVRVSNPCGTRFDTVYINFRNCEPLLTVPNAFTPDQDGLNDVFLATGVNISSFNLQVYNRWGELLFESNDLAKGWDGRKGGIKCPSDVYVWMVSYQSTALDKPIREVLRGTVVLLR